MKIKKTKFQKRLISLLLILFLCTENFAAIVSDNDGSAFITKAEFDSLKNSFQSQIDQYNTSIDSKIDGAIAAYLAGIQLTTTDELSLPTKQTLFKTLDDVNFTGRGTDVIAYDFVVSGVNRYSLSVVTHIGWGVNFKVTYNPKSNYNVALGHLEGSDGGRVIWRGWATNFKKTFRACRAQYGDSGNIITIADRIGSVEVLGPGRPTVPLTAEPPDTSHYKGFLSIYGLQTTGGTGRNYIEYLFNLGMSSYYTSLYGSVTNTYDDLTDKLILVRDYNMPWVYDNDDIEAMAIWDSKYVEVDEWKNLGHNLTGGGFRSKALNDTATYTPGVAWADVTTELNATNRSEETSYIYKKHAHSENTDYWTTVNKKPVTDQYGDVLIEKIRSKFPAYIDTTEKDSSADGHPRNQGGSFYNLRGGLVLTDISNNGKLSVTATNPTSNNIYFWVSDKPIEHNGVGLVTDKSKGAAWNNAVQINAGQTEKITFEVKKGDIIFFRFGRVDSTTSYTTRSGGQVQIDKIVLERE